jgi:hypothetical protein
MGRVLFAHTAWVAEDASSWWSFSFPDDEWYSMCSVAPYLEQRPFGSSLLKKQVRLICWDTSLTQY